jgi:hypothetical protein
MDEGGSDTWDLSFAPVHDSAGEAAAGSEAAAAAWSGAGNQLREGKGVKSSGTYRVYVLVDPRDGEIRYVGCTRFHPDVRLFGHLRAEYRHGRVTEKSLWVRKLRLLRLLPIASTLAEGLSQREGLDLERTWIRRLRLARCKLLNVTPREGRVELWPPVVVPGLPQWWLLDGRVTRRAR